MPIYEIILYLKKNNYYIIYIGKILQILMMKEFDFIKLSKFCFSELI
jgi:hypothetical protein